MNILKLLPRSVEIVTRCDGFYSLVNSETDEPVCINGTWIYAFRSSAIESAIKAGYNVVN